MSEIQPASRGLGAVPLIGALLEPPPVVAVLRLSGVIGSIGAFRRGLSLSGQADAIERAFKLRNLQAVALAVNSPGGSPVQSSLIAGHIRQLAEEKQVPVVAFCEDVAASGGYWLACAADEIYADASSIIGSIGVVSGGFGLQGLIEKLGVERRLHTAGEKKAMLDPFQPEKPADVKHLKDIQGDIHLAFKDMVRARRGKRLKGAEKELFSGAFWAGAKALELGLVDGLGDIRSVMRERFGEDVKLKVVGERRGWLRRLRFGATSEVPAGADWAGQLVAAVEERLTWSRFGL
ncbi:MAG: S49 family peptidase [Rhodospirillales bacterium CG15_BIG_FIL_POST_REV_8_21_14_020_66_15]|nr:MAG: S49 family peptidase [Rhodospirillales bacterium CG15_BIG_FIL_POST_REV_8_21_14_020_66_15]